MGGDPGAGGIHGNAIVAIVDAENGVTLAHHGIDKVRCGFLLELETLPDAIARVDEDREAQRKVGLGSELDDRLRLLCLEDFEIVFGEVIDEAAFLIRYREQELNAGHFEGEAVLVVLLRSRLFGRRLRNK